MRRVIVMPIHRGGPTQQTFDLDAVIVLKGIYAILEISYPQAELF
jgi:hypothetical protein